MYSCNEFLMSNEDRLPLRVARGDEEIPGTLKIDHFLNIFYVNMQFRCGVGQMSFRLHVVGLD